MSRPAGPPPAPPAPRLLPLAAPLFAEMLWRLGMGLGMGLVGTVLAARLGDTHGATFALCSRGLAMVWVFLRSAGPGFSLVMSQARGGRRRDEANRTAWATLGASGGLGAACVRSAKAGAQPLLRLLNAPSEVLPLAVPLLRWLAPALLPGTWHTTLGSVLRAHLQPRLMRVVNPVVQLLHLTLAVPLMHGLGQWGASAGLADGPGLG